ncbi:MAG TPA: hypothetical protein VH681_06325, partial [Nitrospiraceae bacterium]
MRPAVGAILMVIFSLVGVSLADCAAVTAVPPPVVVKRTQLHMGTLVSITVVASDNEAGHKAVQAGFDEIK